MFRTPRYLEKTVYNTFLLNTPITFPANNQFQKKTDYKFKITDRDNWYDWYNAYFRVQFTFEAAANGGNVAANTESAPIKGSFSLINGLTLKSGGKQIYNANNIHKVIFIKNLLEFSDDYARSTAKQYFWFLDTDATTVTAAAGTNSGIKARGAASHGGVTVETIIPLNRFSFFEDLEDRLLPPLPLEFEIQLQNDTELIWQNDDTARRIVVRSLELRVPRLRFTSEGQKLVNESFLQPKTWPFMSELVTTSSSQRDMNGTWLINPGLKNVKHVFIFFQRSDKTNALTENPYLFDTFDIDGDNSAKLTTCKLQYGVSEFYPEGGYDEQFKSDILHDLLNYKYLRNDYNTGVQLHPSNFKLLYPVIYFDLRENKNNATNDSKALTFSFRLNEAATEEYTIFGAILYEDELVIKQVGSELVVV